MAREEVNNWLNQQSEARRRLPRWEIDGIKHKPLADLYYYLIAVSWTNLLALSFGGFVLINLLFAVLYFVGLDGVSNAQPGSFSDAFFFSVQTFSTIGFGSMSPNSIYTHALVTIESFAGLVAVALATGLIFAKFARPNAAVDFSEKILIHNRDGVPHLHFRLANQRVSEIYNMQVKLSAAIREETSEGHQITRNIILNQVRDEVPLFTANWTSMHRIDENSPLYGITEENIHDRIMLFIVTIEGTEGTLMQTVQAGYFYRSSDVLFNQRFIDMLTFDADRGALLLHGNLNKTEPNN